jgi:hypothetical protein
MTKGELRDLFKRKSLVDEDVSVLEDNSWAEEYLNRMFERVYTELTEDELLKLCDAMCFLDKYIIIGQDVLFEMTLEEAEANVDSEYDFENDQIIPKNRTLN